jgi:ABC-type amino acid transport substrate-binding protein
VAGDDEAAAPRTSPGARGARGVDECAVENLALLTGGVLTVGTGDVVYPPWMLNDDPAGGEGFENGLVYALAAEMGFDAADVVWVGRPSRRRSLRARRTTTSPSSRSR